MCSDSSINTALERASLKLGELNSFSKIVPDIEMFIKMHIFKEAVVSSRIEGTRTNIEEAFIEEENIDPERREDWREVKNYVSAMNTAIEELEVLPLSLRLIRNAHRILLSTGRGENKSPGEFRKSQNWIGGAAISDALFIPPAHSELPDLLSDFESFLNNEELTIPYLVRIAIAHYQFETIHPFLDGNGRIGRLLITLYLVSRGILDKPLLYLSDFFERNKMLYYDNLTYVRTKNDLGQWIRFFMTGVAETAGDGVATLHNIIELKTAIEREKIIGMGKRSTIAMVLLTHLFKKPVTNIKEVRSVTDLSPKAANDLVRAFIENQILEEITGYKRNRIFAFKAYLKLF